MLTPILLCLILPALVGLIAGAERLHADWRDLWPAPTDLRRPARARGWSAPGSEAAMDALNPESQPGFLGYLYLARRPCGRVSAIRWDGLCPESVLKGWIARGDDVVKIARFRGDEPPVWACGGPCPCRPPQVDPAPVAAAAPVATGIEALVCADIAARQARGLAKYGQTLADNPAGQRERLQHAYEEALDLANYLRWEIDRLDRSLARPRPHPAATE